MTWVRVMKRDEPVEEDDAELAGEVVAVGLAEHARAVGDVDLAVEDRLDQPLHLRGQVLAVGVEGDDDLGPRLDHQPVAGAQRRAAAAVDHVAGDRPRRARRRRRRSRRGSRRRRRATAVSTPQTSAGIRSRTWPMLSASL